jgi:hypothetical protein
MDYYALTGFFFFFSSFFFSPSLGVHPEHPAQPEQPGHWVHPQVSHISLSENAYF